MLDLGDPEYQLRWPRDLFTIELRQIVSSQGFSLTDAIDLLFEEALAGRQPRDDLADAVKRDQAAAFYAGDREDEYAITRSLAFAKEVLAAADQLPALRSRRYWIARRDPPSPTLARPELNHLALQRDWDAIFVELNAAGYFDRAFGSTCLDDPDASTRDDRICEHLERHTEVPDYLWTWPPSDARKDAEHPDLFYSLIEIMHDAVARPRSTMWHDFYRHRHYSNFSRPAGQAVYRWKVNDLLREHGTGLELADTGDDRGLLVHAPTDGREDLVAAALVQPGPDGDKSRHAITLFRARTADVEAKRSACIALAGVLEARRGLLKTELLSKDEGALFQIANQFGVRHQRADQHSDYDAAYLDWLFWWYLATVELTNRLLARDVTSDG